MIYIDRHPLVRRDLREIVRHVAEASGDKQVAKRRLDEIEELLGEILSAPGSGPFLGDGPSGWRVRHGGRGRMITIVFGLNEDGTRLQVAVVAFGGQDWVSRGVERRECFQKR